MYCETNIIKSQNCLDDQVTLLFAQMIDSGTSNCLYFWFSSFSHNHMAIIIISHQKFFLATLCLCFHSPPPPSLPTFTVYQCGGCLDALQAWGLMPGLCVAGHGSITWWRGCPPVEATGHIPGTKYTDH